MLTAGRRFTERIWAVEGCNGVGRHIAHRLVHDGETVLDVPAQVRVFATGNGRKTDPVDAHAVTLAALRAPNLVAVQAEPELVVMSMPATQARALVATTKPRDIVGKTRRRLTVELITELEAIDKKMKTADKDLRELVIARGSTLLDLQGIGPFGVARLLADVGDIHRFANRHRFASWNGTGPLDASSENSNDTVYPVRVTAESTGHCTSWESSSSATRPLAGLISMARKRRARRRWRRCGRSNAASRTSS